MTTWIRHPSYTFFVPDTVLYPLPWEFTRDWVCELFNKEGAQLAAPFFQQYEDIRRDDIVDCVRTLCNRQRSQKR